MAFFSPLSCKPAREEARRESLYHCFTWEIKKRSARRGRQEKRSWMAGTVLMEKSCINDLQYVELFQVKQSLALLLHSNKALGFLIVFKDTRVKWRFLAFIFLYNYEMQDGQMENTNWLFLGSHYFKALQSEPPSWAWLSWQFFNRKVCLALPPTGT